MGAIKPDLMHFCNSIIFIRKKYLTCPQIWCNYFLENIMKQDLIDKDNYMFGRSTKWILILTKIRKIIRDKGFE